VVILTLFCAVLFVLSFAAWRRYLWVQKYPNSEQSDICEYSLTEVFSDQNFVTVPHQKGVQWLTEVFNRSAKKYPELTALHIPCTGESLTFAELDAKAKNVASALAPFLTGPDQVVAVAMSQDNWQIVAAHLGILKAGGVLMFLDTALPDALITHMLDDAEPVVVLTRGQETFRDLPTVDLLALSKSLPKYKSPAWLDDPAERLATIFYTSGTTGMPKGVECPHAGYVNLALSYADYFELVPGMDATSLTSSLGYDGSISEMYSAWVSGCAVVMISKEQMRSGPDLVNVLREAEITVLFCPPVLLTTLTSNPEEDLPYPLCRYIVPAGEAFPATLVEPWTRGRRQIINTYGPTEASTDTSRQSLRPGEPVTIGTPLANVTYVILEEGQVDPLPHGEIGELCIGGVHVTRGYRNLPQQTAEKFISHSRFGRLYRTGDRCKIDRRTKRVYFLGRVDTQIKVRGHRVEVQAVEDILQNQFDEIESAVLDYQNQELVAFVVAPSISDGIFSSAAPAPQEWMDRTRIILAEQLPEPSVPTRIFVVDKFVMKSMSGKIDRDLLPDISKILLHANSRSSDSIAVQNKSDEIEQPSHSADIEILEICRAAFETPIGWDDSFADSGGHSIVIARLAQLMHSSGREVPVRALLSYWDTPKKLARGLLNQQHSDLNPEALSPVSEHQYERDETAALVLPPRYFSILQLLFLALLYAPPLAGFLLLIAVSEIGEVFIAARLWEFIAVGFVLHLIALVAPFGSLLWVLGLKRLMGSNFHNNKVQPGIYPKWSRMHLRIWCLGQLENSVLRPLAMMYRSPPLLAFVLRRLGATVGENLQCAHDADLSGPFSLLSIGDNVAIQTGAYVHMSRWAGQNILVGPISLESDCKIGMRAAIVSPVTIGRGAWINPFTAILNDVGPGEMWNGAPALLIGHCTELKRTMKTCRRPGAASFIETGNVFMQILLEFCLTIIPTAIVAWLAVLFFSDNAVGLSGDYFQITPLQDLVWQLGLYSFATIWFTVVLISVLVCLFIRFTAVTPGLYRTGSFRGALLLYRIKKMNQIQRRWTWTVTGQYLRALAGMRFARLGASECDIMFNLVPELTSVNAQVFWSNGCFSNSLDYGAGYLLLKRFGLENNFFAGNNSVSDAGQYPANFLLGVSTPANDLWFRRQLNSRPDEPVSVAGNPPIRFGNKEYREEETTMPPSFPLFLGRMLINDFIGIGLLPAAPVFVYALLFTALLRLDGNPVVSGLFALMLSEVVLVFGCVAVKKILVGSDWGADNSTAFWSWRHFGYFFSQDCFFAWCIIPLTFASGTVFSNIILRWMGCRIGDRTIIMSPMQASDWNAVSIGDDCIIAGFLQFHTFENMVLRVKKTDIQAGCVVNFGATVMGGAKTAPATTLLPLSLVLKDMHLSAATYQGSPTEAVAKCDIAETISVQLEPNILENRNNQITR